MSESRADESSLLCSASVQCLFVLTNVQIWTFLTALDSINHITPFLPGWFVLRGEQDSRRVDRFKMNRGVVFVKDPRLSFVLVLLPGFKKGISTPFHRCPDVAAFPSPHPSKVPLVLAGSGFVRHPA